MKDRRWYRWAILCIVMIFNVVSAYHTPTVFPDSNLAGINIQKSVGKLVNGDSIRILYFGQSIVSKVATGSFINWWPDSVTRSLRAKYPTAKIKDTNAAISGCDCTCMLADSNVKKILVPWRPDLIVLYIYFHVETQMEAFIKQIVSLVPNAEVVVFDFHWSLPKDTHWNPAGQQSEVPWEDALSWDYLPFLCEKYKLGYLDIRTPWDAYQATYFPGRAGQDSLTNPADGIHLTNTNGNYLMWQLVKTYFVPQITTRVPTVDSASALGRKVWITFSEKIDSVSARTAGNYSIDSNAAPITGLTLNPDFRTVTLYTASTLTEGNHVIGIGNVKDRNGNTIAPGTQKSVMVATPTSWSSMDIGRVYVPGSTSINTAAGVLTMRGNGEHASPMNCAWAASSTPVLPNPCYPYWMWRNEFQYAYQTLTGNFTFTAQISNVDSLIWKSQAGIMIREDVLYLSKFVAINTLKDSSSARFEYVERTNLMDTIVSVKPRSNKTSAALWLRLTRTTDSTIQAFSSTDGSTWNSEGAVTVPMTDQVTAGLFVCGNEYSLGPYMAKFSNAAFSGLTETDIPLLQPVKPVPLISLTGGELRVTNMVKTGLKEIVVADIRGRTVWSGKTGSSRYAALLPRLSRGIYIVSVRGAAGTWGEVRMRY